MNQSLLWRSEEFAFKEVVLEREAEVGPSGEIANHGEIDDFSIEGFHLYESPYIDEAQIAIGNNSNSK